MRDRLTLILLALTSTVVLAACGARTSTPSASSSTGSAAASPTATSSATSAASTTSAAATSGQQIGFEGVPLELGPSLGSAATTGTGVVDGIHCAPVEQLAYHIHAHLIVYVKGRLYSLPPGIGIPGSVAQATSQGPVAAGGRCYYWLHTHTDDGVIHIESPTPRIYTLGDFFAEWHQPLGTDQVASVRGPITAFVDGKPWKRSLRAIPLISHADIQLNIGEPAPPLVSVNWSQTGL